MFSPSKKLVYMLGSFALLTVIVCGLFLQNFQKTSSSKIFVTGPIKYNCELSGGSFKNGSCTCTIEADQTQESMYDKDTGFCQSTIGGPAGDAFNASVGLPYGEYAYWTQIVTDLCTNSGGNISGAACICPLSKTYSKVSGRCQ